MVRTSQIKILRKRILNKRNADSKGGIWKIIGILGSIGSIIGLVTGIYFYNTSNKERVPTLIFDPIKTELVKKDNIEKSPIKVYLKNGDPLKTNLIATTFYFFNAGKESIKEEHILEQLQIIASDSNVNIVDFNILKISRPVTNIELNKDSTIEKINFSFKILEQNDGVAAQIIFSGGDLNTKFQMTGTIEGVKEISNEREFEISELFEEPGFYLVLAYLLIIIIGITKLYKHGIYWLIRRYLLIIRSEDDFSEKTTFSFTYAKLILLMVTTFSLSAIIGLGIGLSSVNFTKSTKEFNIPTEIRP